MQDGAGYVTIQCLSQLIWISSERRKKRKRVMLDSKTTRLKEIVRDLVLNKLNSLVPESEHMYYYFEMNRNSRAMEKILNTNIKLPLSNFSIQTMANDYSGGTGERVLRRIRIEGIIIKMG